MLQKSSIFKFLILSIHNLTDNTRSQLNGTDLDTGKMSEIGQKLSAGQLNGTSQNVFDDLSRPINVYNFEIVADELAEVIAKHTTELTIDDNATSSIASFKVSATNATD